MPTRRRSKAADRRTRRLAPCNIEKFETVSPQTLLQLLGAKDLALVNTLDKNIVINTLPPITHCCHGSEFKNKSCSQLSKYKEIILYCANDTCSASHNYAKKLIGRCPALRSRIFLYTGGVYEWALLSFAFPNKYSFYNLKDKRSLSQPEIQAYFTKMQHRSESEKAGDYPKFMLDKARDRDHGPIAACGGDSLSMKDKVCVVTGATSGLGLETAKLLLREGARHVTLTFFHNRKRAASVERDLQRDFETSRFKVVRADARTEAGNALVFDRELRRKRLGIDVGPIDAVDINAGIFGPANMHKKHIFNISVKDYEETMETNLTGYFLSLKYFSMQALKHKVKNASAVCIKSIYGSTGSLFSNIAYQTSKHGVMGLVHQAAIELARPNKALKIVHPIRVNAVSPTFSNTALTKPFLDRRVIRDTIRHDNPTNELARKQDIAQAVVFLLSDRAHSITGVDLPVDCGVLAESIPTYKEVERLNKSGIQALSCCGDTI